MPEALEPTTWPVVVGFAPWPEADFTLDTALLTPEAAAAKVCEAARARRG